ncbi:hypothetical protein MKW98_027307 [Papaver atlanticum]|uniref:Uncharacterized protein n=1 Tax=Papaver atlanticum TaxID=357466 RepID=A0AAD4SPL9_9MAGN|nr:hypothetical protein MKW98_027307 [Papaver atlanticum]
MSLPLIQSLREKKAEKNPEMKKLSSAYVLRCKDQWAECSKPLRVSNLSKEARKNLVQDREGIINEEDHGIELESCVATHREKFESIKDGEIFATINQKDGMFDTSIQRIMSLSKKLNSVHEVISCDPAYLGKAKACGKAGRLAQGI